MSTRPPQAHNVLEESTVVVHRTHDIEQARVLALHFAGPMPWIETGGEQAWIRTCPSQNPDMAFYYRAASPGERGAFRAVFFSNEPERRRWWRKS